MLVIRMQRTGRKGHAQFRVVVQDSRRTPTSGKIVALIGNYNPHSKTSTLDKEKASYFLEHGARPSERVARLLQAEGVKLPAWVKLSDQKQRSIRNVEKRRSTRPAEAEGPSEQPTEESTEPSTETDSASESAGAEDATDTSSDKAADVAESA
jgi:small subunit ribosomal protein S16